MRSARGRNWTTYSTEMAEAGSQDWIEDDCGLSVLPRAGAVPPPRQCARHGATCPPTRLELIRQWVSSQPTGCRSAFADPSTWAVARGRPNGGTRVTVWSPFYSRKSSRPDQAGIIGPPYRF
jgi:hypothetical protein